MHCSNTGKEASTKTVTEDAEMLDLQVKEFKLAILNVQRIKGDHS